MNTLLSILSKISPFEVGGLVFIIICVTAAVLSVGEDD